MRRFVLASHGPLSAAILSSAGLIAGSNAFADFGCIQVAMEDSGETIREAIDRIFSAYAPEDEIVALTDVAGGNVTNILTEYVGKRSLHIVAGMNLGMVLEAGFSAEDTPAAELVETLVDMGKTGVKYINAALGGQITEDEI